MSSVLKKPLPDVQARVLGQPLAISKVGIRALRMPVRVLREDASVAHSVATWELDVALAAEQKGAHMSRFVALLNEWQEPLSASSIEAFVRAMLVRLEAVEGTLRVRFALFIEKQAPVSKIKSLMDYEAGFDVRLSPHGCQVFAVVEAPLKSLCPCSKEISDYGAHNQRSKATLRCELNAAISFEAIIRHAELSASSELYALLKRPDEKFITEAAYDNPKFVEDLVRDIAARLEADPAIASFRVEAENFESIHNHSVYAVVEA